MFPPNSNGQSLAKLALQNYHIYEQLKKRELDYLNLIKDLHQENQELRKILKNFTNKSHSLGTLSSNHNKTPTFYPKGEHEPNDEDQEQPQNPIKYLNDKRFSFSGSQMKENLSSHTNIENSSKQKLEVYFDNAVSQYYGFQNSSNNFIDFHKKNTFAPIVLTSQVKQKPLQNYPYLYTDENQQFEKASAQKNTRKVSRSKLWGIPTNLSLNKDSSISQTRGNAYVCDDSISEYSQLDTHHKFNPHKQYLVHLPGKINYKRPKQNDLQQNKENYQQLPTNSSQNQLDNQQKTEKNEKNLILNRYEMNQMLKSYYQKVFPRNTLKIHNKVYL